MSNIFNVGDLVYTINQSTRDNIIYASLELINKSDHYVHKGIKRIFTGSYGIILNFLIQQKDDYFYRCLIGNEVVILSNKNLRKI